MSNGLTEDIELAINTLEIAAQVLNEGDKVTPSVHIKYKKLFILEYTFLK